MRAPGTPGPLDLLENGLVWILIIAFLWSCIA